MATLQPLSEDGRAAAAETLAAAFMADPLFAWAVPVEAARHAWLRTFMRASLWLAWRDGHTWAAPGTLRPGAVLSAIPPGKKASWARQAGFGLRLLPRILRGQPSPARVAKLLRLGASLEGHHPAEPHWALFQLVVDPACQGQGLGRAIMEHAATLADGDGVAAYLETSNPVNLSFYRRFGFEVVDTLEGKGGIPPVWTMLRPPK